MRHLDSYRCASEDGINLDGFVSPEEPWAVAEAVRLYPLACARELFPTRPEGYVSATRNLKHYAYNKATAMRCRLAGNIVAASNYERICEDIYNRLPEFARW